MRIWKTENCSGNSERKFLFTSLRLLQVFANCSERTAKHFIFPD